MNEAGQRSGCFEDERKLVIRKLNQILREMSDTRLYKAIVGFENGSFAACNAVEYQGAIWLVPKWLPSHDESVSTPERMIRLDQFRYQRFEPARGPGQFAGCEYEIACRLGGADFLLNDTVPRSLLHEDLTDRLRALYVVLERPDAKFQLRDRKIFPLSQ
jgi:hypothetical protein